MWNQRRMNGWIFIEIIIAGFFLWTVIDPIYVLMATHLEDKGYEEKGRYVLQLGAYGANHGMHDTTVTKDMKNPAMMTSRNIQPLVRRWFHTCLSIFVVIILLSFHLNGINDGMAKCQNSRN